MTFGRVVSLLVGVSAIGLVLAYDEGYIGPSYKRLPSIYDPVLEKVRCLDEDRSEFTEGEPPCLMLTLAGRRRAASNLPR